MEDPSHNAWATPHDIALQQMEYSRRQEALAREANSRYQRYQTKENTGLDDLAAGIGNLGYGQTDPDPATVQAETNLRATQRKLHEAEQALAAERTMRAQAQYYQQTQHPPPPPPPPPPPHHQQAQHPPPPPHHHQPQHQFPPAPGAFRPYRNFDEHSDRFECGR